MRLNLEMAEYGGNTRIGFPLVPFADRNAFRSVVQHGCFGGEFNTVEVAAFHGKRAPTFVS